MKYFPIFVDLEDRPVFVAGGGEAAAQKLRLILKTDAQIVVFSASVIREISQLESAGRVKVERRPLTARDLNTPALIYAAAEDESEDARVAALAKKAGVPINVVDNPKLSNFITPAIVDRDPVTIAIGTEGTAPVLARTIKAQIEAMLPHSTGQFAELAASWRDRIAARISSPRNRRNIWQRFFASGLPNSDSSEAIATAELRLQALVGAAEIEESAQNANTQVPAAKSGRVSVIHSFPNTTDELSEMARGRLFAADVVIFDNDCAPAIRELVRREAVFYPAENVSLVEVMAKEAKSGHQIVHLVGAARAQVNPGQDHLTLLAQTGVEIEVYDTTSTSATRFETTIVPAEVGQTGVHQNIAQTRTLQ